MLSLFIISVAGTRAWYSTYSASMPRSVSLVVDLSAVSDAGNADALGGIVNYVHDTPVAHADAPLVFVPSELLRSRRAGIFGKHENFSVDPGKQRIVQRVQFLPLQLALFRASI